MTPYVDPVAVERACGGDRVYLRPIERRAAVQRLTRAGRSSAQIAAQLGITERTVRRCRRRPPVDVDQLC